MLRRTTSSNSCSDQQLWRLLSLSSPSASPSFLPFSSLFSPLFAGTPAAAAPARPALFLSSFLRPAAPATASNTGSSSLHENSSNKQLLRLAKQRATPSSCQQHRTAEPADAGRLHSFFGGQQQ
ncbi:hypothetical protein KY290_035050 [Solanum tuberosum]|uniref:Uncharacterized protein n=1 Tax=Solanum tuberosum TaxID=4113 RepID=A0ABQ7U6U8_SOLTU|nr:hypothetical protein KY289_034542 [Solanum tuberosum]KAH0646380.1 hypothetical protein KY284_034264 [Solanum tuberosum]KAH0649068.1 hypothetical protein KY285_034316 [Solanum tuberosum]KAH0742007.1 hypothetical protein KY290_035050 [Solanum tuberosum]